MKQLTIIFAALTLLILTACSGDNPEAIPSNELLNVVQSSLTVEGNSNSASIEIRANCRWAVTLSNGWEGMALETREGEGNGTIRILTGVNPLTRDRNAQLIVESYSGVIRRQLTLTQLAGDVVLDLSTENIEAEAEGDAQVITVSCNTDWTVSGGALGFTADIDGGSQNGSVKISIDENMKEDPREATFTFQAEGVTRYLNVRQKGKIVELSATPMNITAQAIGGSYQIGVTCNADWTASSGDSWAMLTNNKGSGNGFIGMMFEQNPSLQTRNTNVIIIAGSKTFTVNIEQLQGAPPIVSEVDAIGTGKYTAQATFSCQSPTSEISSCGVCYSTHNQPTMADNVVQAEAGSTSGQFTLPLNNLESGRTYYIRAFAVNATDMTYGEISTFTTSGGMPNEDDNGQPSMTKRR